MLPWFLSGEWRRRSGAPRNAMAEVSKAAKVGLMSVALLGAGIFLYRFVSRETGTGGG